MFHLVPEAAGVAVGNRVAGVASSFPRPSEVGDLTRVRHGGPSVVRVRIAGREHPSATEIHTEASMNGTRTTAKQRVRTIVLAFGWIAFLAVITRAIVG